MVNYIETSASNNSYTSFDHKQNSEKLALTQLVLKMASAIPSHSISKARLPTSSSPKVNFFSEVKSRVNKNSQEEYRHIFLLLQEKSAEELLDALEALPFPILLSLQSVLEEMKGEGSLKKLLDIILEMTNGTLQEQMQSASLLQFLDPSLKEEEIPTFLEERIHCIWPELLVDTSSLKIVPNIARLLTVTTRHLLIEKTPVEIQNIASKMELLPPDLQSVLAPVLEEVREFAEDAEKYGYKGAYLKRLERLLKELTAPSFLVSTVDIERLVGPKLNDLWNGFKQSLQKGGMNDSTKAALKQIQKFVFKKIKKANLEDSLFQSISEWLTTQIETAKALGIPPPTLVVRSTSREDKQKNVNAGGNKTTPYLEMDLRQIRKFMAKVAASSFSEKSMGQRAVSHDDLSQKPILAVVIQVRIGEPCGGVKDPSHMMVSGVANSTKGELAVVHAHPSFGEKVVGGAADIDHYHLLPSGYVAPYIQCKENRLICAMKSSGKVVLKTYAMPPAAKEASSLPLSIARKIGEAAVYLRAYSGNERDIEFVYDPKSCQIYILQDRPLPAPNVGNPSYVTEKAASLTKRQINGEKTIVYADEEVRVLHGSAEIVIAQDLPKAFDDFIHLKESEQELVKCACVLTSGGELSHAAVNFKGVNIPVIVLKDATYLENALKMQSSVIVDVQQASFHILSQPFTAEELCEMKVIASGRIKYPSSDRYTLHADNDMQTTSVLPKEALIDAYPAKTTKQLLQILKATNLPEEYEKSLHTLFFRMSLVQRRLRDNSQQAGVTPEIKKMSQNYAAVASTLLRFAYGLLPSLQHAGKDYPPYDLRRLAVLDLLEKLLLQRPSPSDVRVVSFEELDKRIENAFSNELFTLAQSGTISKRFLSDPLFMEIAQSKTCLFFSNALRKDFFIFLDQLRQTALPEQRQQLKELLEEIAKEKVERFFYNGCFPKAWKEAESLKSGGRASKTLQLLNAELSETSGLRGIEKVNRKFRVRLDRYAKLDFTDPKIFSIIAKKSDPLTYVNEYLSLIREHANLKSLSHEKRPLSKAAVIELLKEGHALIDAAIKLYKGSSTAPEIKATDILEALSDWHMIMGGITSFISQQNKDKYNIHNAWLHLGTGLENIQLRLKADKTESKALLNSSDSEVFRVDRVKLGNPYSMTSIPETIDDAFTLLHQDIDFLFSLIIKEHLHGWIVLPSEVAELSRFFESGPPFPSSMSPHPLLMGMNINDRAVQLQYDIAIAHHACSFAIESEYDMPYMRLKASFYGANEYDRWTQVDAVTRLHMLSDDLAITHNTQQIDNFYYFYEIQILKNISREDLDKLQNLILIAHRSAGERKHFEYQRARQFVELVVQPNGKFANLEELSDRILKEDPLEAFSLYTLVALLSQDLSVETQDRIRGQMLEAASQMKGISHVNRSASYHRSGLVIESRFG